MTPGTAPTSKRPMALRTLRTQLHSLGKLLELHDGLRAELHHAGPEATLRARGWWQDPTWGWRRYGMRRDLESALAHEARIDLRRWLSWSRGWRYFPDGSTARSPTTAGIIAAATIERALLRRGTEIAA